MQFRDLGAQYNHLKSQIDQGIEQVMKSSQFILGPQVSELERALSDFVGVKHCVSCANGSDALQLVLMAWGIGPGDAVFTTDFSFFASASCISAAGATPVLVDIDLDTFNISPIALEKAIEETIRHGKWEPKAIIPVDLFGLPANYPQISEIANKYNLRILEDGAQGFGGAIGTRQACSFGDAATTSFFPAKPLGCYGDGGAIFTDNDDLDVQLRSLRCHGRSPKDKYDNRFIGMNSRLDTLQAVILLTKLEAFAKYELDAAQQVAAWYTERLKDAVRTPKIPTGYFSSWAQYTVLLENKRERDALWQHLKAHGIPSAIYYPRGLHQQTAYADMRLGDDCYPHTVEATQRVLSLPMHPYLTEKNTESVCDTILTFFKTNNE